MPINELKERHIYVNYIYITYYFQIVRKKFADEPEMDF